MHFGPMRSVGISSMLSEVTSSPLHSPNGRQHACRWGCATRLSNSLRTTPWSLPQTRAHTDSGRPTCLHGFQAPYTHPVLRITRPVYGWMRSSRYSRNTHLRKCAASWWSQLRSGRHPDSRRYLQSPGWSIYCMLTAWLVLSCTTQSSMEDIVCVTLSNGVKLPVLGYSLPTKVGNQYIVHSVMDGWLNVMLRYHQCVNSVASGNGLAPNKRQVITLTKASNTLEIPESCTKLLI